MLIRSSIVAALCLGLALPLASVPRRGAKPGFGSRVYRLASAAVDNPAPGVIVGVMKDGQVLHDAGYGVESVKASEPAWSGSVFQIGSVTKQMTAAGILALQETGTLSLDDDVREWIPELDTRGYEVTIRHLLNHTSGVPEFLVRVSDPWSPISSERVLLLTNSMPWASAPGERFSYNNTGYWLAGLIIERASERPWYEYLRSRLFLPAGMTSTAMCGTDPFTFVPEGYVLWGGSSVATRAVDMSVPGAAGSICSTAGDLMRWNDALWNGELLSPESLSEMRARTRLSGDRTYGYGLGVGLLNRGGRTVMAHGGSIQGFQSDLFYDPVDDLTIVVLMNITSGGAPATALSEDIYGEWREYAAIRAIGADVVMNSTGWNETVPASRLPER